MNNALDETLRRRENWRKGLPIMDLQAYEYDRKHDLGDRKKPFEYDKFGTKFTVTEFCKSECMPNKEELQMDNFKLQEENKMLLNKINMLEKDDYEDKDTTVETITEDVLHFLQTNSEKRHAHMYDGIKAIENREPSIMPSGYFAFLDSETIVKDIVKYVAGDLYDNNMEKDIDKVFRKICKTKYNKKWDSRGCLNA